METSRNVSAAKPTISQRAALGNGEPTAVEKAKAAV